jgi:hypothetical protein
LQIEADAGVVFRNFKSETGSLSFTIDTVRPASVTIREFSSAPVSASIDNVAAKPSSIKSGATVVTIPAGKHSFSGVWTQPAGSGVSK